MFSSLSSCTYHVLFTRVQCSLLTCSLFPPHMFTVPSSHVHCSLLPCSLFPPLMFTVPSSHVHCSLFSCSLLFIVFNLGDSSDLAASASCPSSEVNTPPTDLPDTLLADNTVTNVKTESTHRTGNSNLCCTVCIDSRFITLMLELMFFHHFLIIKS